MSVITSLGPSLTTNIPDDLTVPQFILDSKHPLRPTRVANNPWFIDDETGKEYKFEEVRKRTQGLANGIAKRYRVGEDDVVCIFSPNHIDYPTTIWATHKLGAIVSAANPSYTAEELEFQLQTSKATLVVTHPRSLQVAMTAVRNIQMGVDRIILIEPLPPSYQTIVPWITLDELIEQGLSSPPKFVERRLKPGENKTKLAFLSFSSGTTGKPKAVEIPHSSVIANVLQVATFNRVNDESVPWDERRFRPGDVSIGVLPFFHIYGLIVNLHSTIFFGHTLVVMPKFNFVDMLKSIVRYRITHLWIVPPQVVLFCKHPATKEIDALSHVRFIMMGAAPVSPELQTQFKSLLPPKAWVGQGYGMTETATVVTMQSVDQQAGVLGSAGRLVSGTEAKVVKPDGTLAGPGEPGELVVRGPQMALRYLNNEQATKETFQDGWVRTGDEVIFNEDGDMFIVDRLKEILKVRGFQVAPAELEGHLLNHKDIIDAGVVGVPDEFSGEVPLGFVVLHENAKRRIQTDPNEAERIKLQILKLLSAVEIVPPYVSDVKVRYKWLDGGIEFIEAIPKNPSGKILRRVLREHAKKLRTTAPLLPRL